MNRLVRIALLAYPREFRRRYGNEWARTIRDMRVHRGLSRGRVAGRVLADVIATAPRMRWETMMGTAKTALTILALLVVAVGLVIGSPAVAVPVIGIAALAVIRSSRHDRPIAAELTAWSARWYAWLAAGAGLFVVGFGALLTEEDGGLTEVAWATWILSWLAGAIIGVIGLGLGVVRLAKHRTR